MEQKGIVTQIIDDIAVVIVQRKSACGDNCAQCSGCETTNIQVTVKNPLNAEVGNTVQIESDSTKILIAAFLLYILPLIIIIFPLILAVNIWIKIIVLVSLILVDIFIIKKYESTFKNILGSKITRIFK